MGKRVRITNSQLNRNGFRVLTDGMDTAQYQRNPVLLYMHDRGNVIGYIKDLRTEGDEITGELMFDEASELSQRCKKQWEFGSLRMVSVGIDVLETSSDREHLAEGQQRPTVTKSRLFEVSVVDVGANDDAIVLRKDNKELKLGDGFECALPLLSEPKNEPKNQPKKDEMENQVIALQLGLAKDATEEQIVTRMEELKKAEESVKTLKAEQEKLQASILSELVEKAVAEKRLAADKKEYFITLGKQIGSECLKGVLETMQPQVKLSQVIGHQGGKPTDNGEKRYQKLSEVPPQYLMTLRDQNPEEYRRLYKAEYGMECDI